MTIRRGGSIIAGAFGELPSQTGQSGKYLTTNGSVTSWSDIQSGSFRNIGEIVTSTIPLTDAELHLLDGALISGGGIYDDFVQYIAGLSGSYPQCFTDETTWQNTVSSKGACGKFVYTTVTYYAWNYFDVYDTVYTTSETLGDTVSLYTIDENMNIVNLGITAVIEEREGFTRPVIHHSGGWSARKTSDNDIIIKNVRLPKITGFIEGTVDSNELGNLINAGLPNITGHTQYFYTYGSGGGDGAFEYTALAGGGVNSQSVVENTGCTRATFNASLYNSIYGNSNTVQPQAIKVFYYIVIATTTKTDIEVDIDEVITDLNSKANDVDVVHKTGTELITGYKVFTQSIDRNVDVIRGQIPSTDSYSDIRFVDNNNNWLAGLEYALHQDKSSVLSIYLSDSVSNTTNVATGIQLRLNTDGTVYTTAQTPSVSSNTSDIATTAYVNTKFQVVSTLPASPNADVFYYIPE